MSELWDVLKLIILAVVIVGFVKYKADKVRKTKDEQILKAKKKALENAQKQAKAEFKEKVEQYKMMYDEDYIKYLVREYGEYFEDFVDDEEEYEEFKKGRD